MTLAALLETHDEGALAALASVGLVRRAGRDLEAGKASVEARDDTSATVTADGQKVTFDGADLASATCGCPATGVCRHILLAVLALRANSAPEGTGDEGEAPAVISARESLAEMTEAELQKFAGADWDKAITQASISTEAIVTEDGANLTVRLPDTDFPVVFLGGLGPKGAVYKGPKTTKRRVVAAAALVARQQSGAQPIDQLTRAEPDVETLSSEFLERVRAAIEASVGTVFSGGSVIAEEHLFDLSISARAQAAPRLTALLRVLVGQARQARDHHFAYSDERFLADASFAYALATALVTDPNNPGLTGVLRRHYAEAEPMDLILVGAGKWRTAGGARGTRLHAYAPETGTWYGTGQARGAGMDPGFMPESVYHAALWGGGTAESLIGQVLQAKDLRVSSDNQIAWDHGRASIRSPDALAVLAKSGAVFSDFAQAKSDLAGRAASGLQRMAMSLPLLLKPQSVGEARFDDIAQVYRMPVNDEAGRALNLTLPADRVDDVKWLWHNKAALAAVLVEVIPVGLNLSYTPISAYLATPQGTQICNLTFDSGKRRFSVGAKTLGDRAWSFLKTSLGKTEAAQVATTPMQALCHDALETVAEVLRFGSSERLSDLVSRAETLGLATLHAALSDLRDGTDARAGLRAAFLASESLRAGVLLE